MAKFIAPYSDDYMTFDELSGHYTLTAKAIENEYGINLEEAAKDNPKAGLAVLNLISAHVYRKIHEHAIDTNLQDCIIATTKSGRKIIYKAMLEQFAYVKQNGDLSKSVDKEKRSIWFDDTAYETLLTPIPEIGRSICYVGC